MQVIYNLLSYVSQLCLTFVPCIHTTKAKDLGFISKFPPDPNGMVILVIHDAIIIGDR